MKKELASSPLSFQTTLQILKPKLYLTFLDLWCQQLNMLEGGEAETREAEGGR